MITLTKVTDHCARTNVFYGRCMLHVNHGGTQHTSELGTWCECCSKGNR